ncbi:MAG: ribosomal L7Ae/L30e/S12e/Gadd45 family protein [Candidatus Nanoarchaeia archaeon]|nr:ribosomal L7Ae/L30e/S12e/Gadd45 family protein [Candidatus Nanoarchaeia archaeon]
MKNLQEAIKSENLTLGSQVTIKKLRQNKVKHVFLASNCKEEVKKDIEALAKINKAEIIYLDIDNKELGIACKKPFTVSVLSC